MMKDNQNIELLDAYLENILSDEQQLQFDQKMASDSEFANMIENAIASDRLIKLAGRENLKRKLIGIHENMNSRNSSSIISIVLKIAAVFIGIISVSILVWYSLSPIQNYGTLYANNFEPYTNLLTVKGETSAIDEQSLLNKAMYQYDKHDYHNANLSFQRLLEIKRNNDTVLFYFGISRLGAGDSKEAIELLQRLERNKTSLFSRFGHVKWYLALAHLNYADEISSSFEPNIDKVNSNLDKCKSLLIEIVDENGDYSNEAEEILEELE